MYKNALRGLVLLMLSANVLAVGTPYIGSSIGVGGYRSQPGVIASLFGGYGVKVGQDERIYLGAELNANIARFSNYNTTYGLGASFIPGVMLTPYTMLYGRLGINSMYVPHGITNSYNFGAQYGLGVQTNVVKNWDIRGEYAFSNINNTGQYSLGFVYKFE